MFWQDELLKRLHQPRSALMFDLIAGPTLLAYVGLVLAIAIAPGPNVLFVMTQSA
jgi:hypothetical protein